MRNRRSVTPPVIAPTLLNAWVDFGAGFEPAGFWRGADQTVRLHGMVKNGVVGAGTPIMTLPAGYRPAAPHAFVVDSNGAYGRTFVDAAGNVTCDIGNNAYVSLSSISFRAAP